MCYEVAKENARSGKRTSAEDAVHDKKFITRDGSVVHTVFSQQAVDRGCDPVEFTVEISGKGGHRVGTQGTYKSLMGHVLCMGNPDPNVEEAECDLHDLDMVKAYDPSKPLEEQLPKAKAISPEGSLPEGSTPKIDTPATPPSLPTSDC